MYLRISNKLEIEQGAFTLLGACTKRDDKSKIGFFGSGLKYAIAVLLREGIDFRVFSGKTEVSFSIQGAKLRETDFDVIAVNGVATSMTTSMGPQWKLWHAVREIYCNALDEPGCEIEQVDGEPVGTEGETAFYVNIDDVKDIVTGWDTYFANKRTPVCSGSRGKMYLSVSQYVNLYRKGIRCADDRMESLFDYDFIDIPINESRVIESSWEQYYQSAKMWGEDATVDMLERLFKRAFNVDSENHFEARVYWEYCDKFNENWLTAIGSRVLVPWEYSGHFMDEIASGGLVLPRRLIKNLKSFFKDKVTEARECGGNWHEVKMTPKQEFLLKEAYGFFREVGLPMDKYAVKVVTFDSPRVLGSADGGRILLSTTVFDRGRRMIVETMIEEASHIESGQTDCTRGFQNYLIDQIITLLENTKGIFL